MQIFNEVTSHVAQTSQLFTHSASPLRNVPQEALTFVLCVCAILKACTFYFSDNLTFLTECVLYNVVILWYYYYKIAYPKDLTFPLKRSFDSALEVSYKLKSLSNIMREMTQDTTYTVQLPLCIFRNYSFKVFAPESLVCPA